MSGPQSSAELVFTELRRTGTGAFEDTPVVFRFTGVEHCSSQGDLSLHLQVKHVRKEIPGGEGRVVHQTMAATWQPFDVTGEWDDKYGNSAGRTGPYAITTFDEFAAMVGRIPDVRMELDGLSFTGILTDLKIKYRRKSFIGWTVTLSPSSNGRVTPSPATTGVSQSIPKWISDAADHSAALGAGFKSMLASVSLSGPDYDSVTGLMLAINDAIDRLQRIGTEGFGTDAEQKLLLVAATMRRLRGATLTMCVALQGMSTPLRVAYDDALMSAQHRQWVADSVWQGFQIVGLTQNAEADVNKKIGLRPKKLYYPKRGESLEKISAQVYGSADGWRRIYDANKLTSLQLSGSEELFIPDESR